MKGIGILLVLLGHTDIPDSFRVQIYAFHMPLFFFCSGFFYKNRAIKDTFMKCVKQLLIPWLFFVLVRYLSMFVLYAKTGNFSGFISDVLLTTNIINEHSQLFLSVWFLICLFWVRLLYAVFDKLICCVSSKYSLLIMTILAGVGYSAALFFRIPLFIDTSIGVLLYYHLGRLFYNKGAYKKTFNWLWITIFAIAFVVLVAVLHPHVELKDCEYPIYHVLLAMVGIYTLYQVSVKICKENALANWLAHCGISSISLLGLHRSLWLFVYPVCLVLHFSVWATVTVQIITALFIILPVDSLLRKYAPILIGTK